MSLPPITINNDSKYYADQVARMMREYGLAVREAALEEAIGKAMEWTEAARKDGREYGVGMDIAQAIRALKDD